MAKHKHKKDKHKKKRRRGDSDDADGADAGEAAAAKLFIHAASGRASRLRRLLAGRPELVHETRPADAATPLHQACRFGHADVVGLLLRRHANAAAADTAGNTPAHLAAMHGHWLVLQQLVQHADNAPDLDLPNKAGLTVRQITQLTGKSQGPGGGDDGGAAAASFTDTDDGSPSQSRGAGGPGGPAAVDDDAAWRARLADELSDDFEGPWAGMSGIRWGEPADAAAAEDTEPSARGAAPKRAKHAAASGSANEDGGDDDDGDNAWADRLWQDMEEHRKHLRAAAAAAAAAGRGNRGKGGSRPGLDRDAAAQERQRKAAAAAAESARILREEQAKDSDWRAAMMRQIEQAALPLQRDTYESRWAALESRPAAKPIAWADVPWPVAQQQRGQQQQCGVLALDAKQLRSLVLSGAKGPADIKLALRRELMRWHPDKFVAKWGPRLVEADRGAILEAVHAVAQHLTALKQ